MIFKYISTSKYKTILFGQKIGKLLKKGNVITLNGDLGTGKTTLISGIAKTFGIKKITSPTFNIIKSYKIKSNFFFYHIDAYRLEFGNTNIGIEELINKNNIVVIEWFKFIKNLLNVNDYFLEIFIKNIENEKNKRIFFLKTTNIFLKNKIKKIIKL